MARITLLDGGMGQELVRRSGDAPTGLWSTRVMMDHPGLVEAVHRDYFNAGATIATANTYAIFADRLDREGLGDQLADLRAMAMAEARAARDAHGSGRVAAAIGPLRGSYRPEAFPDHDTAVTEYRAALEALAPEADLVIFETVASLAHARAALDASEDCARPVWIAATVDDEDGTRLRSGEPVADLARALKGRHAEAALANCSAPEAMGPALGLLAESGVPFGAYANGFEQITKAFLGEVQTVDVLTSRRDMGPERYAAIAMSWVGQGATIIGGCCETGPDHIAAIAAALRAGGHEIV
ncbi:homocysteine S-methyltransferase family protein [Litorisediminicola beolgyonensis]|uniref:Homocysteine S-methyltransferase family protein n=1 Tax=Litorisediminicola beolgyonensis TaxID=1173614 RepID=A0ABW3ZKQ4_9RHOB